MINKETVFAKDTHNKKLIVTRGFDAPLELVWQAWTDSSILDQWWAPRPYRAETKAMDFKPGGYWLYCMVGPTGDVHWCKVDYKTIDLHDHITTKAFFCDDQGTQNTSLPVMHWLQAFSTAGEGTNVHCEITFESEVEMETIIKMGFQEGFKMGLGNLDQYIAAQTAKA